MSVKNPGNAPEPIPLPMQKNVSRCIELSREVDQCRRCRNELLSLNMRCYESEEWKITQDCRDMLERKIAQLRNEMMGLEMRPFTNNDKLDEKNKEVKE